MQVKIFFIFLIFSPQLKIFWKNKKKAFSFDVDPTESNSFKNKLKQWFIKYTSHVAMNALLPLLTPMHADLPKIVEHHFLLKEILKLQTISNGCYYHSGISRHFSVIEYGK